MISPFVARQFRSDRRIGAHVAHAAWSTALSHIARAGASSTVLRLGD